MFVDFTFDISCKEQISFKIHYVPKNGNIYEHLSALEDSPITTGLQTFKIFENICTELSLNWLNYLIGFRYDEAQNMKTSIMAYNL